MPGDPGGLLEGWAFRFRYPGDPFQRLDAREAGQRRADEGVELVPSDVLGTVIEGDDRPQDLERHPDLMLHREDSIGSRQFEGLPRPVSLELVGRVERRQGEQTAGDDDQPDRRKTAKERHAEYPCRFDRICKPGAMAAPPKCSDIWD